MPQVIDWSPSTAAALLAQVARHLQQGHLVALPTEAGYVAVAAALNPDAVTALSQLIGSSARNKIALTLFDPQEVLDWLPHLRGASVRLARAFWPGPLTLVSKVPSKSVLWQLPTQVVELLTADHSLAIRVPDHPWTTMLRCHLQGPLVSTNLPELSRETGQLGVIHERLASIINDGPSPLAQFPAAVAANGRSVQILDSGAIPRQDLEQVVPCRILFVCTGNTCRSPLAEVLCRQLLSANLGCAPERLAEHGFIVQSAGLAAASGNPATQPAVAIAQTYGTSLDSHRSRPLSLDLLSGAQFVFTMTGNQLAMLQHPGLPGTRAQMLDPCGEDVEDPIGGADAVYAACAQQLQRILDFRLPELLESGGALVAAD